MWRMASVGPVSGGLLAAIAATFTAGAPAPVSAAKSIRYIPIATQMLVRDCRALGGLYRRGTCYIGTPGQSITNRNDGPVFVRPVPRIETGPKAATPFRRPKP